MKKSLLILFFVIFSTISVFAVNSSPIWEDQIVYFLMIDRFANGDTSNDILTKTGIERGNVNSKYNGGDIKGIINELDYIKKLGVTVIWITPPVANQWWDGTVNYGGYHGYWARHFKKVEEHFGDLELYKKFIEEAHKRNMYVIQDIVTNHTGNFLIFKDGKYHLNDQSIPTDKPEQYPFNMNDYNDPEQRKLNIYHWPSEILEPNQYNTEFSELDDLNTENPLVIEALKDSYSFWIKEANVDGFRIDTAIYVPQVFWREFLNGNNGIYENAKKQGKNEFLVYGEAWIAPQPFTNDAEKSLKVFFDNGYNSMLDFPLQTDIKRVLKEGKPTSYLKYRLEQRDLIYDHPSKLVTFVDNHDMDRFLKGSDINSLKQVLALIFTIPGIPTIYYGTEQNFVETREAMFKEGFAAGEKDHYDTTNQTFKYIQELIKIRKSIPTFRYGKVDVVFSEDSFAGPFIYKVSDGVKEYVIFMNTSTNNKYATYIDLNCADGAVLTPILTNNMHIEKIHYSKPLNILLTGKALGIFEITNKIEKVKRNNVFVEITNLADEQTFDNNFLLKGTASNTKSVAVIVDDDKQEYAKVGLKQKLNETWEISINISDFTPGKHKIFVKAYGTSPSILNYSRSYMVNFNIPTVTLITLDDPKGDDRGPTGNYIYPKDSTYNNQMDIRKVEVQQTGAMINLVMTMENVTDIWNPINGFDHVSFQIFFDDPNKAGAKVLPLLNANMPDDLDWDYALYVTGWSINQFKSANSNSTQYGDPITNNTFVKVNKEENKITLTVPLSTLDTKDIAGWKIYITTYDYDGTEALLRVLTPEGGQWSFGGGNTNDPKIMDDLLLEID